VDLSRLAGDSSVVGSVVVEALSGACCGASDVLEELEMESRIL